MQRVPCDCLWVHVIKCAVLKYTASDVEQHYGCAVLLTTVSNTNYIYKVAMLQGHRMPSLCVQFAIVYASCVPNEFLHSQAAQ